MVVAAISGCTGSRNLDIVDVAKTETILPRKTPEQGPIHSLFVTGSGAILGEAEFILVFNDGAYMTEKLSGEVAFQWKGDWYSDQVEIVYASISVTGGRLDLKYAFSD